MPMRFPYLKSARVKLQERKNACLKSTYESAERYIGFFLEFIRTNPVISPLTRELSSIATQKFSEIEPLVDGRRRSLNLPSDPAECAAFFLRALELQGTQGQEIPGFRRIFGKGSNSYQDMYEDFYEQVLVPLCSYIDERIDDGDLLLYMLSRYQRECNWFQKVELQRLLDNTQSNKLEEAFDEHLRSWLFREGIDYPFSTPRGPSGRADIVVWEGEEPLALEVKVFDGADRDLGHVAQGLWQSQRYAHDYGKPFGYLIVFNTSGNLLGFDQNVASGGPPCVVVCGINVFAITINVFENRLSASKEKPLETKLVKLPESATA
jgi:hypothetical protein